MADLWAKLNQLELAGVQPEALFPYALGCLAALILFYLFRLGRKKTIVTAGPIWEKVAARRRIPLQTLLSFLLQVLIFGALFSALTDPRDPASPEVRRALAVVIDASARMSARDGEETRLNKALARAEDLVGRVSGEDRVLVVVAREFPEVLAPPSGEGALLAERLSAITAGVGASDLAQALSLAETALLSSFTGENWRRHVVVLTDNPAALDALPPPEEGIDRRILGVGRQAENAALVDFSVRPAPVLEGGYDLLFRVRSFAREPLRGSLVLETETHTLGEIPLALSPGAEVLKEYHLGESQNLGEGTLLSARLSLEGDAFSADDQAFTVLPATRRARVILVTAGNRFLELALKLNPEVSLEVASPEKFTGRAPKSALVIFDRVTPEYIPPRAILVDPRGSFSPFRVKKRVSEPRLTEWNGGSPILKNALAKDIRIEEASIFVPDRADERLMGTAEGPVALLREYEDRFLLAFGFDFTRSDLVLRVAFPVMLRNALVRAMGWGEGQSSRTLAQKLRVGQPIPLAEGERVLSPGDEEITPIAFAGKQAFLPEVAGFYRVVGESGSARVLPVNFDSSTLSALGGVSEEQGEEALRDLTISLAHDVPPQKHPYWVYLLLAALAVALLDWLLYHGRIVY